MNRTVRTVRIVNRTGNVFALLFGVAGCMLLPGDAGRAHASDSAESSSTANAATDESERLFVRRVARLLQDKCVACHGADEDFLDGSLDLTRGDGLAEGGDSGGPAIVPGAAERSPLFLAVTRDHDDWSPMPPKEAERLTEEQLRWVRRWIDTGAAWPSTERSAEIEREFADRWSAEDGVTVATSGGLAPEWTNRRYQPEDLWAYQPVEKPSLPGSPEPAESTAASQADIGGTETPNPIDRFLGAAMPEELSPASPADRVTLIRRVTFGLTGLPPTPDDVTRFVEDDVGDAEAFAKVVDRLLDSPHYGERMAQHWLDVTRYADSSGFANDYERGNAWRYRDYVVRAFNDDKRFDEFAKEQIAGDELRPGDPEMQIATGFLRMGPWELTGMEVAKVARQRFLDDVTNSVGETFLAHSLQCARCHDHKFDPLPTRDYYSVQAVFATTQLAEPRAEFLDEENTDGFDERKYLEARREDHLEVLRALDETLLENAEGWYAERGLDPERWHEAVAEAKTQAERQSKGQPDRVFDAARKRLTRDGVPEDQFPPKLYGFTPEQYGNERVARKGLQRLRWESERYQPFALSVYSGRTPSLRSVISPTRVPDDPMTKGELEATCILTGGDPFASGEPVEPGVLSVLSTGDDPLVPASIPTSIEGRRKAFAEWVASPENPLTTRTIVNRIWMWHFGEPIAGNPNNFGASGKRPTHPKLLDWLASTFVEEGWSVKRLTRQILLSEAYRRSGEHPDPERLERLDPLGTSYAVFKPRRLTAEELRDARLSVTGELNPAIGGIPCRPEINLEAAMQPRQVMGTFAAAWTPNAEPSRRHRRSLYVLRLRGLPVPAFDVFNTPSPDFSCERRESSTVTPQAFALFNSHASHARALALADRLIRESDDESDAVRRCFHLAFSRDPSDAELDACLQHWRDVESMLPDAAPPWRQLPSKVVREAVEENTGENFTFTEGLHAHRDFIPDLRPVDVDRHTRALADLCLAILNANEFVYVY